MTRIPFFERNLADYSANYLGPFEEIQIKYRRKKVLEILNKYSPKIILEVGCGKDSIVNYLSQESFEKFIIVEPIIDFLKEAVKKKSKKVEIFNEKIEQISGTGAQFDFIIISSLLHEVVDPLQILKTIHGLANDNTIVHINVPNAYSLHRLLAKEMGIINSVFEKSAKQIQMQQSHTFDLETLIQLVQLSGFEVIDKGSFFVKPFTHLQMQQMIDKKIINTEVIEGLNGMINYLPDMGSEIFLNIRKEKRN